ncbi:MAG TPA: hypothetical protein VJX67_25760, partial [Blastocatellia bacterium]|nr:hypothetical protein [Blastocatellia bacterium]
LVSAKTDTPRLRELLGQIPWAQVICDIEIAQTVYLSSVNCARAWHTTALLASRNDASCLTYTDETGTQHSLAIYSRTPDKCVSTISPPHTSPATRPKADYTRERRRPAAAGL